MGRPADSGRTTPLKQQTMDFIPTCGGESTMIPYIRPWIENIGIYISKQYFDLVLCYCYLSNPCVLIFRGFKKHTYKTLEQCGEREQ